MNRRDALTALGTATAIVGTAAFAQKAAPAKAAAPAGASSLVSALDACISTCHTCLEHCIKSLSTGDTMMAECAATTRQMLPLCEAMAALARQGSSYAKELSALCAKACRDCEAACKKHAGHFAECKACQEACQRCATECEKYAAAK